ncbi:PREDICTED: coiled-coil domain-containing protein 171-like isoform X4 [Sturnus vulgaris]|uniref:coiled-coil domain-containing protein 171-like isoform X4 n=1 Tax=Sturnus vulgaris TaxID=9172 RepID=UPI00071AA0B0|nr:PREDICTED: coiled-coil domain-containing protein 171-like isoform X4 [Sturnus vulgaris]
MNSPSAANISSGEANRSGSDIQGPLLPQDRNPSEMDTIEDLRKKLQKLEEKNLELTNQHNHDMSRYEKEIMKLRLELQRGEALLRVLESEMSFARKDAHVQMYSAEDELCDAKAKLMELQARGRGPRHQRFRYASESQLDQSQSQDFRQALPESDLSIEAMCNRTNSASGADLPSESFWLSFVPEVTTSPRGPAPDAHWGEPRYRSYTVSGSDIPSGETFYTTCSSPDRKFPFQAVRVTWIWVPRQHLPSCCKASVGK